MSRSGQLGESQDGRVLWWRWVTELRGGYHQRMQVSARIRRRNEEHRREGLRQSPLYEEPATGHREAIS